jgi:hypothetical protein
VPYDVVEVNPLTKSEMAFSKEYKKVPVLVVDGTQINNSGEIMRWLEDRVPSATKAENEKERRRGGEGKTVDVLGGRPVRARRDAQHLPHVDGGVQILRLHHRARQLQLFRAASLCASRAPSPCTSSRTTF